uniref:histidine kinase n=1 Tax=Eiseniibacteriota bacterium TaxID=2212470 RepID=A0A832MIK3_UNCEI
MDAHRRDALDALLRRVGEVRGLSDRADAPTALDPADPDALLRTIAELVEELERSHRRLIETSVQLVSLREVASHLVSASDARETTRTVTRYLVRAFGFEDAFLLLADPGRGVLAGSWTRRGTHREHTVHLDVPLLGDHGAVTRAWWLNRTVVQHAPHRHPVAALPDGHAALDLAEGITAAVCVPLQRSQPLLPLHDTHELCGARCILGDAAVIAPPPGAAAEGWAAEREERQRHCLRCELLPLLGVLGVARRDGASPREAGDVERLESIALSVAPMVENARLTQDLRRSERFREHVLDSMASALVAVDLQGRVLTYNRMAEELLGGSAADAVGRPAGEVLGREAEARLLAALHHGRTVRREEVVLHGAGGRALPASLTTSLLRTERRSVTGAVATFVDLTPIKRAEEHARRLDRLAALGRFTSSVAHEIRNPLAGIAAGVQYLIRALPLEGPQRESLSFIEREVKRLDRILQDLFDITHPRALRITPAPPEDTVRRALECAAALMEERGVRAELAVGARVPAVPHDTDQLQQVVLNLVKNAAEASPRGGAVRVTVEASEGGGAAIRVRDEGCGIAEEHLKSIFEPFFTTKKDGSGLGLYVSHDIVKRHGGAMTVHSEPGRGTVFTVELPPDPTGGHP